MSSILAEVVALRRGPGKLTPNEYFYYRLWEPYLTRDDRRRFVGKQAQQPMHVACNDTGWYAAAADKLLFHTLMAGAGLPTPELLAVAGPGRLAPSGPVLPDADSAARFLRNPRHYPMFAKPIDGKYSIAVFSADDREQAQAIEAGDTIENMRRSLPKAALPELLTTVRQETERGRTIAGLFRGTDLGPYAKLEERQRYRLAEVTRALDMKRADGTAMLVGGDQDQVVGRIADLYMQRRDHLRASGSRSTQAGSSPGDTSQRGSA